MTRWQILYRLNVLMVFANLFFVAYGVHAEFRTTTVLLNATACVVCLFGAHETKGLR